MSIAETDDVDMCKAHLEAAKALSAEVDRLRTIIAWYEGFEHLVEMFIPDGYKDTWGAPSGLAEWERWHKENPKP